MSDLTFADLTASQIEMIMYCLAGVLAHIPLKCQREKISPKQYFLSYPLLSAASLIISLGLVLHSLSVGDNEMMTYFGTGFIADAVINRYKKQMEEDENGQVEERPAVGKDS